MIAVACRVPIVQMRAKTPNSVVALRPSAAHQVPQLMALGGRANREPVPGKEMSARPVPFRVGVKDRHTEVVGGQGWLTILGLFGF